LAKESSQSFWKAATWSKALFMLSLIVRTSLYRQGCSYWLM
jgi:hypothetical protein